MLLSNLTSHTSLLPQIVNLTIPIVGLPLSKHYPPYHLPAAASASSSFHPDYRDPAVVPANAEAGQEEERDIEALRALVQAFEDGAGEGVKEGKGKRKGECHFLASVFANVSMVSPVRNVVHSDTDVSALSCRLRDNFCLRRGHLSHIPLRICHRPTTNRC
jgi:hypothetical protein